MVELDQLNMAVCDEFPDIKTQRNQIQETLSEPMIVGQTWYLIDDKWFKKFKCFVGLDDDQPSGNTINPGPIDNTLLLDPLSSDIKHGLVEKLDYIAVPASTWNLLNSWYGMKLHQTPIGRKVINVTRDPKVQPRLEVYKVELNLYNNPEFKNPISFAFSCADTISKIEEVCRTLFKVPDHHQIVLRCFYGPHESDLFDKDKTVSEEHLDHNFNIVMEIYKEAEKNCIRDAKTMKKDLSRIPKMVTANRPVHGMLTRNAASVGYSTLGSAEGRGPPRTPGLSGLMNLGNTCFLNSIIQCLSNCQPITQYFLDGNHESEINATNPLGQAGQIASSFADLISMMWSGRHAVTVPHDFKLQLTKFAPQFAGCQQHDAQELLTFLLDGLHEDLNRVKEKPYRQNEENDEKEDDELARTSWEYFLRRNDSIIIDHFHGMLKSRVVCPSCEKVSIKFDTFSTLSLPLPLKCERNLLVRFIGYDTPCDIIDMKITVSKKGFIRDVVFELCKLMLYRPNQLIFAEIRKYHFHRFLSMDDPIESIDGDKIYVFEIPDEMYFEYTILPVVMWEAHEPPCNTHFLNSLFGIPFLLHLPRGTMTIKKLYDSICEQMARFGEAFKKTDESFLMDYESADDHSDKAIANKYPFTPFLVNTFTYESKKIQGDEDDLFDIPENFGREVLALQMTKLTHAKYYKLPTIRIQDYGCGNKSRSRPTLDDCLSLFTKAEKLAENNAWHCPNCNMKKRATKQLDLWKLPNILILHLKRFVFNETRKEKLDIKVDFPLTGLNIDHYVINRQKENLVYDLIGVCNHYGSLMSGHYTANCKSKDGQWYCFDDYTVTPVSSESVQSENAYVLFYQRQPVNKADPDGEKADL